MNKPTAPQSTADQPEETPRLIRTRPYIFPDIDGGGPAVTIEATSLEEATELFKKGQAAQDA